ncbi:MAG: LysM domain-containing protein [Chloroflexi bacterium]|nr:LysM domain-containing protein [Chloroflexota bacterium]
MHVLHFPDAKYQRNVQSTLKRLADHRYIGRRFLPSQDDLETLQEHTVTQGDRIDNLAAHFIGDPEQFWRIADANSELDPQALTAVVGRQIRIALPEGIPGASANA